MNLLIIKRRFSRFVLSFDKSDVDLAMQYVHLAITEYNIDPQKYLGKFY